MIFKNDPVIKKSISRCLPFLKMRLKLAVITEQVDLCFLKSPADILSDFPVENLCV